MRGDQHQRRHGAAEGQVRALPAQALRHQPPPRRREVPVRRLLARGGIHMAAHALLRHPGGWVSLCVAATASAASGDADGCSVPRSAFRERWALQALECQASACQALEPGAALVQLPFCEGLQTNQQRSKGAVDGSLVAIRHWVLKHRRASWLAACSEQLASRRRWKGEAHGRAVHCSNGGDCSSRQWVKRASQGSMPARAARQPACHRASGSKRMQGGSSRQPSRQAALQLQQPAARTVAEEGSSPASRRPTPHMPERCAPRRPAPRFPTRPPRPPRPPPLAGPPAGSCGAPCAA